MRYRPVTQQAHGAARWRRPLDWSFARDQRAVPVLAQEASALATALPLVFMQITHTADVEAGRGALQLVALLRLAEEGVSPFVGADGRWRAAQIPPLLRLSPFGYAPVSQLTSAEAAPAVGSFALMVDEGSPLFAPSGTGPGDRLFAQDGRPTPDLAAVIAEFEGRRDAVRITARAIAQLQAEGLLVPWQPPGAGQGGAAADPLFVVDAARLQALPEAAVARLHAAHALGLAYVQIVSMHHVPWMQKASALAEEGPRRANGAGPAAQTGRARGDPQDFLSALRDAQSDDIEDAAAAFLTDFTDTDALRDGS